MDNVFHKNSCFITLFYYDTAEHPLVGDDALLHQPLNHSVGLFLLLKDLP